MFAKHQFKYTYEGSEDFSPLDVTFDVPGDASLSQMLYNFQSYLKGCGFVFDGELQIVDETLDNIDTADEVYGCMADWDKDEEGSSCCGGGCGCEDSEREKAAQKLKEWSEGLAKLEEEVKEQREIRENASKRADELQLCGSEALAKACVDGSNYVLKLATGEVYHFTRARIINNEWIHIVGVINRATFRPYERGIDIRLSSIVWVMDAPEASILTEVLKASGL